MLTHENIGLHNVVEFHPAPGGGIALRRFPDELSRSLSPLGRMVAQDPAGIELRFVTEAPSFRISLGCQPSFLSPYEQHGAEVVILRGSFVHSIHRLESGKINHLQVTSLTAVDAFRELISADSRHCGFAPTVWRVLLGRCAGIFYNLETFGYDWRPPFPDEIPARRWLAYGSSITNGASPSLHLNSYIYHAARLAGLDVLNQGLSGSCLCETEMADYLGARDDYEIATLEVGVNMRNSPPDEFKRKVEHLLEAVCISQRERRVFLVTIYPNVAAAETERSQAAFVTILHKLQQSKRWPNLSLIDGGSVLDNIGGLTTDLVHPSDYGHARMGQLLGEQLRQALDDGSPRP